MAVFNNVTALARTTVRRGIVNQWMNRSVLWWKLTRDGRKKPETKVLDGGKVRFLLNKAKNSTFTWYGRGGTIKAANEQLIEGAEYAFAHAAITTYLDGVDEANNEGSAEKLKASLEKIAVETAQDQMGTEAYNDGSDAEAIIGLNGIVTLTTLGGLTTTEVADWAAKSFTASIAMSRDNVNRLWVDISNYEKPDLGLTTPEAFDRFRALFAPNERYEAGELKKAGFDGSIMWNGVTPIIDDPKCTGAGSFATTAHYLYFVNTKHLDFIWHPKKKITVGEPRIPEGKDAVVIPYKLGCLMGTDLRKAHGYWSNISPSAA